MAEILRDDVTLFYTEKGEGEPLLLIHGHTLDRRVWDQMTGRLQEAGLRLFLPDLRGHGRSSRPEIGYHWSHHGADMTAVLDSAAVDRASVVGFSVGGGIALEMAVSHGDRVADLVLISPVMPDRPFEPDFLDNLKQVARTVRGESVRAAMLGPWMESPLFARSLEKPGMRERLTTIVRDFPGAEYLATGRDAVERGWKIPDRLAEITAPALVIVGGHEMPGFRGFADEAAENIPGARLQVIDGCGHLLPFEAPAALAELIVGHVTGRRGTGGS